MSNSSLFIKITFFLYLNTIITYLHNIFKNNLLNNFVKYIEKEFNNDKIKTKGGEKMNLDLKHAIFTPEKDFTYYSHQEKKLDEYFARKYIRLLIRLIRRKYYRRVHIKVEEFKADLLISKGYRIYVKLREDTEEEYKTFRIFLNSEALEEIIFLESRTDFLIKELEATLGIE